MNFKEAFNTLNSIYTKPLKESSQFTDRQYLIDRIKNTGRNYNFDKWTDAQLFAMWQRIAQEELNKAKLASSILKAKDAEYCKDCGTQLSDDGSCPRCDTDFGWEENLDEDFFDYTPGKQNWISMSSGTTVSAQKPIVAQATTTQGSSNTAKQIVTIVQDPSKGNKLRAQADDGTNGKGWVAFPNNLRTKAGQQYEVDGLSWNGKNYRVIGNIVPIASVANNVVKYAISLNHNPDLDDHCFLTLDHYGILASTKYEFLSTHDLYYSMGQACVMAEKILNDFSGVLTGINALYVVGVGSGSTAKTVKIVYK